jgi:transposase
MTSEDSKCGDDCKLVEMLATKTSKEQAMENAIAAVQTGNISQRGAAKRFKVNRDTLSRRLKNAGNVAEIGHDTTQPKSTSAKPKAADKAERDQWFADHQAGLSARKIAEKFGRSRLSIIKEIKRREQPTPTPTPTPTPAPTLTPTPTPAPTEADSTKEQILADWNGQLGDHHEKIIRREKPRNRKTEKFLEAMGLIKSQLKQTMDAASKDTREYGAGFLRMYMVVVEEQLRRENLPQIKPSLEALRKEARDIWKYADESLRLLQLQEGCSELK